MAVKLTAAMPEALVVGDGFVLRFTAVSPTDGSLVSGVQVSSVNIDGDDAGSGRVATIGQLVNPVLLTKQQGG